MSNNHNFNNNFRSGNITFRFVPDFPPPPLPPPLLVPFRPPFVPPQPFYPQPKTNVQSQERIDEEFIKTFETQIPIPVKKFKPNATTITQIKEEMQTLVMTLNNCEAQVKNLRENINNLSEEEWAARMKDIEVNKKIMSEKINQCAGSYLDMSRRLFAKRTTKRLRLKRLKEERRLAKKERMKQLEERSRKIDENLQKIKDDILKAQQEEQAKLEADVVLREVLRKKQDAKKCIVKLDALVKLRKARQNTAKGRGENVSDKEADIFLNNIEKLKKLWNQKLLLYEKEESELQEKLADNAFESGPSFNDTEKGVAANLDKWRELLFGSRTASPQEDFHGDIHKFIAVRSQWDQYLNCDGTPLPVGWILPPLEQ